MQEQAVHAGVDVLRQRERIAMLAMYATMAIYTLTMVGEFLELAGAIDLVMAPDEPLGLAYTGVLLCSTVVYIGSVIAVAMWIHRAHRNLHEAGIPGLRFTPGWAVGWYFVPIALLFKPFQAMRELWNESHQTGGGFSAPAPGNLGVWWGLWIVGNMLANISLRINLTGDGGASQVATTLGLVSSICTVGSAWFLMQIIRQITAAQSDGIAVAQTFE